MRSIESKYAELLVHYCLELKKGDTLYIKTTMLGEPLLKEVYREGLKAGAHVDYNMEFSDRGRIYYNYAEGEQLTRISPMHNAFVNDYDAYLFIRAPYNLREDQNIDKSKISLRKQALEEINNTYFARTGTRELRRNLCQYPTQASAQQAGMSLEEYQEFVYSACMLFDENPKESWLDVRKGQQHIVDHLNKCAEVHYRGENIDIRFSAKDRIWMNSDGQTNMPSGEVYTAPVDNSVNGVIRFSYPAIYMGHEVEDVTLWVKDGYVEKWESKNDKEFLDYIFSLEGTRRFGEAAIGTNYKIQKQTKNILFDEKIGGTIHMAIGMAYAQCGGINKSSVHWDMITDMKNGGEIWADGELIYQNGNFII